MSKCRRCGRRRHRPARRPPSYSVRGRAAHCHTSVIGIPFETGSVAPRTEHHYKLAQNGAHGGQGGNSPGRGQLGHAPRFRGAPATSGRAVALEAGLPAPHRAGSCSHHGNSTTVQFLQLRPQPCPSASRLPPTQLLFGICFLVSSLCALGFWTFLESGIKE